MFRCTALAVCLVLPTAALAAPATPEEAARLTALFETYVGRPAPGAPASVTVTPEGEGYRAAFDLARMAAPLHAFGVDVVATAPYVATLTPLPDGTWRVQRGALPQFGFTTKKGLTYSVQLLSSGSEGIFDPKLEAFAHQENQLRGNKTSVITEGRAQRTEVTETGTQIIEAKGPGPADVSSSLRQVDRDVRYQMRVDPGPHTVAAPPIGDMTVSVASATTAATASHERVSALLELWAFLVAHPSRDQLVPEQPHLKSLLKAMIPYVSAFNVHSEGQGFAADFGSGGSAKIASASETIGFDANSANEGLALSIKLAGLDVTVPSLPTWALAALPRAVDLNLATSPVDVGKALDIVIDKADLTKDDPVSSESAAQAMAAVAPDGGPTLAIKPSTLSNGTLDLAVLGAFSSSGAGKARIEAKGLDEEIATIGKAAADDPLAAQAVQILSVAKAFAVPQSDGRLLWEIVNDPNGLTVNGKPLQ